MQVPAIVQVKSLDTPLHYSGPSTVLLHQNIKMSNLDVWHVYLVRICMENIFVDPERTRFDI